MEDEGSLWYPCRDDLLALHRAAMAATDEPPQPLRDGHTGTLESGAARALWAAVYEDADIVRQCALLAIGISEAQAFLDGNKRTALVVAEDFLDQNGWEFFGDDLEWAYWLEAASEFQGAERRAAARRFEEWTRQHVRPKSR